MDILTLQSEIDRLGPWKQRLRFSNGIETPGRWDARVQFSAFGRELPDLTGKQVLDIGANAGGIGFEANRAGAIVTLAEPWRKFRNQSSLYIKAEKLEIRSTDASIHEARNLGAFDVVFCLGLIYHFRHPQLILDELAQWVTGTMVISTQTIAGNGHVMKNRRNQLALTTNDTALRGWAFTLPLFKEMLYNAGFTNVRTVRAAKAGNGFTNDAYFVCEGGVPVNIDEQHRRFI